MGHKLIAVRKTCKTGVVTADTDLTRDGNSRFAAWLTLAFLVVGSIILAHHEMWRDELQAWMIARDSTSLISLFGNLRYEGHPALWYLPLFVISRFTREPAAMQVLQILLATTAVYVFVRFSPFTRLQKILFAFSYYPLYEYGVISRSYVLGFLLVFVFCALFPLRERRLPAISAVLFLMANTSAYGWIIAACLGLTMVITYIVDSRSGNPWNVERRIIILSIAIVFIGLGVAALQMLPKYDSFVVSPTGDLSLKFVRNSLAAAGASHVVFPDLFEQSCYLGKPLSVEIPQAILALFLIAFSLLLFARRLPVLFLYSVGIIGLFIFRYAVYCSFAMRHYGHMFIVFLACMWLSTYYVERESKSPIINKLSSIASGYAGIILILLLAVQLAGGVIAGWRDIKYTYSGAKAAAELIKANNLQNLPILGDKDYAVSSISGYLDRSIYYAGGDRLGTFIVWQLPRKDSIDGRRLVKLVEQLLYSSKSDIVLITNYDQFPTGDFPSNVRQLGKIPSDIVKDEKFWIYLVGSADTR